MPSICVPCAVPHCHPSKRKNRGVSSFVFPVKNAERCKKWILAIKNPKFNENTPPEALQNQRVCSLHFKAEEILRNLLMYQVMGGKFPRATLLVTAVPSINLDEAESAEPQPAEGSRTQASLPEVDSMNRTEVSSTSLEAEVNVVHSATNDASRHVPRTFTAAHETYEANILSLFKRCQICGCAINSTEVRYVRGKMRVKWDCFGGHMGTWKSLLRVKAMLKVDNPEDSLDEEENMMVSEDGSDSNWDPLENSTDGIFTDSDSGTDDSDSGTDEIDAEDDAFGLKLRQLCPDCGKLINIQKAHTCEHKLKPYPCNVCGKRFVSEHHLKVHGRLHKENYKHLCKFCLKTFKTRAHKLAHEQSHPRVKKPYQCPDCPEVFAKIQVRRDHLRNHRGPQQYICHICNMEFAYSNALERHVVTHTGEKQFVCEVCQFSFSQAGHLKSHLRVHTGEKPYQCQHCDKSFNHNVSLKSHIKHYHGKVPDPGMKVQMEKTTRNQSEPEAEKNKMNEMENNTVDVRETHGATLIRGRKKRNRTGRPKGRPQIKKMIASDATDKLKRKLCDGDETDESWSNSDSASDSADE